MSEKAAEAIGASLVGVAIIAGLVTLVVTGHPDAAMTALWLLSLAFMVLSG